jgi:hypothetical protein
LEATLLILLIIFCVLCFGGGGWGYRSGNPQYGHTGIGLGTILLILLILFLCGVL